MLLFSITSIISVMPVTLSEKYGEKAWRFCSILRIVMSFFLSFMVVNMILWIWFPISQFSWIVSSKYWISGLIGLGIIISSIPMLYYSIRDGGKEHMKPMKEGKMFGGIYLQIRHPGILGEMPWYIAIGFFVNSWFLVIWATIFVVLYVPVYIVLEEKDLTKRFGTEYIDYRKRTGALIPKFWQRKKER